MYNPQYGVLKVMGILTMVPSDQACMQRNACKQITACRSDSMVHMSVCITSVKLTAARQPHEAADSCVAQAEDMLMLAVSFCF